MACRNADIWEEKGPKSSSERFNYDYPEAELAEVAQSIQAISRQVHVTQVVLHNNYQVQGQGNAKMLTQLLQFEREPTP